MADGALDHQVGRPGVADLLQAASRTLLRRLLASSPSGSPIPGENLLHDIEQFDRCVGRLLSGEDAAAVAENLPPSASPLALLMRRQLLETDDAPAEDVLEAVRMIETLDRYRRSGPNLDPDSDLRAWLTRPDAFELLVEVAHDLRSPLTSILFLSETMREGHSGELTDLQRSQLGLIYSAALGLISVTSDVVELAKDERNLVEEDDIKPFAVAEVVHGVAEMVLPMAEEKAVELKVVASDHERGYGHPMALSRILLNLATNALKFTDVGYVEIGVTRLSHRTIEFYVRDTGRGIPEDRLKQLFQPFRKRLRDESFFFSGSGLGLSICQRTLRAMGSELEVETRPDWGTRFSFELDTSPAR
ncbi:MAG: HAMP domain-containing sensor histidine kinase [Longimicrobiales bacterium]